MRIKNLFKTFFILFMLFQVREQAQASHLFGAEFTYEYIGLSGNTANPFRYKFFYKIYSGNPNNISQVSITIYDKNGLQLGSSFSLNPSQLVNPITPAIPPGCSVPNLPSLHLWNYETIRDLPLSIDGYFITASINARNGDIDNLFNPQRNLFTYMQVPSPLFPSKSPVFTDTAVVVMFTGDTTSIINSAFDVDGDRLIYSFNNPFENPGPGAFRPDVTPLTNPVKIPYNPNFSLAQPFGPGGYASIHASTGLAKYYVPIAGNYVISFQVKEYRNVNGIDVLIGSTIRDIQLVVRDAPGNTNSKPTFTHSGPKIITITEGDAISPINFTFTDPNTNQPLKITAASPLLDGPAGKNASFNNSTTNPTRINNALSGTTATFTYTSVCGDANIYPLDITVQDNSCPPGKKVESFQIQVLPYRGPQKIFGDTTVCSGGTETYNITGKASATYNWRLYGGGGIQGNRNNDSIRIQWTTPGRYKLTAFETSTGSCSDSVSFFVNVASGINLALNASATAVCAGTPVTLTATGGTTYNWSDGTNTFTGASVVVSPTTTTTYSVSGSGITGCSGTNSITITVNQAPIIDAGADRTICAGTPVTLSTTGSPAGNTTVTWTDGISTFNGNSVTVSPVVNTTYTATLTNLTTGCISTDQVTISVTPAPIVDAGNNQTVCAGTPVTLSATGANTYSWTNGTSTFTGATITFTPTATTTFTVTGTTNTCTSTDQVTVTVNPRPVIMTTNRAICAGQTATLSASSPGISSFTFSDGTNTFTGNNISVSPTATTTYTVTGTNTNTCNGSAQLTVTVNPQPVVNAGADRAICAGGSTILTATSSLGNVFIWSDGTNTFTGNNVSVSPAATTTYTATVTNIATGCTSTDQVIISVNPRPTANAGSNQTVCSNVAANIGAPAVAGLSYSWIGPGLSNPSISNPVVTLPNNTTAPIIQTYFLTVTNAFGCTDTDSVNVQVNPMPVANAGSDKTVCSGTSTTIGTAAATGYTYSWSPATGLSNATAANPTLTITNNTAAAIIQNYTLTTTLNGCTTTDQVTVTVNPAIIVDAGVDKIICSGNTTTVGTASQTGYTYSWQPNPALSSLTAAMPVFTGTNTTSSPVNVKLYVTATANNCSKTDSVIVTVNPTPAAGTITGPVSICPGLTGIKYRITNPQANSYQWSISAGHGTIVAGQGTSEITVNWNGAAAATVSAQAVNAQNCTSTLFSLPVTINPILITPQPIGPATICKNQAGNVRYVMPNPTPGSSFTWTVNGGTVANSNLKGDTVYINWTNVGANSIVVQEASTGTVNCFGNSPAYAVTILASPDPTLAIAGPTEICLNTATTYTLPGAIISTYAWKVTHNGNTTPLTGTTGIIAFTATAPGVYTLTATETNTAGCVGSPISKIITVDPTPVVTQISGNSFACPENMNNQLYSVNGPTGYTYNWSISGGSMVNPGSNSNSIYVNLNAAALATVITVTPVSAIGCIGEPLSLTVNHDKATLELANISTGNQNDKVIELNLQMPGNSANTKSIEVYRREAGATAFTKLQTLPNTATTFTDNAVKTSENVYEYRLESLNECGTILNTTTHKTMLLNVKASEEAKTVNLSWNAYKGWNVSRYEVYAQADNGTFELLQTNALSAADTTVTLTKIASRGFNQCFRIKAISADARVSWSNASCVNFVNDLKFYNVITPNNDGYNDAFVIENIQLYPDNELSIFNRWGTEVYRRKDYDNTWNAKEQAAGTYYFLLKLKDGRSFKNWFEVVK